MSALTSSVVPSDIELSHARVPAALKITLLIIGVMALGAAIAATATLAPSLILLGFCVALSMMTFIGLPMILASVADATDDH